MNQPSNQPGAYGGQETHGQRQAGSDPWHNQPHPGNAPQYSVRPQGSGLFIAAMCLHGLGILLLILAVFSAARILAMIAILVLLGSTGAFAAAWTGRNKQTVGNYVAQPAPPSWNPAGPNQHQYQPGAYGGQETYGQPQAGAGYWHSQPQPGDAPSPSPPMGPQWVSQTNPQPPPRPRFWNPRNPNWFRFFVPAVLLIVLLAAIALTS